MRKPSLFVIFLTVFIDLIGFGIVMPILPIYGHQFGASMTEIGVIVAAYSAMQFIFSPLWGRLSDRVGRRPVLLISLAGGAIAYGIFTYASILPGRAGLWLFLFSRVFAGICGGNINVAQAYIADITTPEKRSAGMGLIGVAFGLGFIFGPVIGAMSARYGMAAPGWIATGLCAANFLLACVVLPESWKPNAQHTEPRPRMNQWSHTLKQPQVGLLVCLFFLATFCFACYETTLSLLAHKIFDYDRAQVGYLFALSGLISALVQGGMIHRLVQRWGEARLIVGSFVLMGLGVAFLPYLTKLSPFLAGLAILSIGASLNRPPTFGLMSNLTPAHEQGATLGVAQSAGSLARIFGPIFAGAVFGVRPELLYLVCGGIALAAGGLAWRYLPAGERPTASRAKS